MEDAIRVKENFYVLARSSMSDERTRVLKYGDTFAVFNRMGDVDPIGLGEHGIYHQGTRHVSRFAMRLADQTPQLLRSTIRHDNAFLSMDLMNVDISEDGQVSVPRGTLHLFRSQFLWKRTCYGHFRVSSYFLQDLDTFVSCEFEADFADIFEVRGTERDKRGRILPVEYERDCVRIVYEGLDGKRRTTILRFYPEPEEISEQHAKFALRLKPKQESSIYFEICCQCEETQKHVLTFGEALQGMMEEVDSEADDIARVSTSHRRFDGWLARSRADLHMMIAGNPEGPYPYAGVPWFNTVFGRDGMITAMECLWLAPWMAKNVLKYLAENQATEVNSEEEAEPGKILHEMRRGEMATLKEVPFGRYYGAVDTTPLFIMLAGQYWERTQDYGFLQTIWPNILAALEWIERYGDMDGDGFVEYEAKSKRGLSQQGWKDSHDSISHADGSLAEPPIALCEVQGYVYAAKRAAARLAEALGNRTLGAKLVVESESLREKFERAFWCEELQSYALALDGEKKQCRVLASNAGHCLFTGIASAEHAARVMTALMGEELFCGWGVRTLGSGEVRYNPMAYHNGSVWPHDNAIIARGLARYNFYSEALKITYGMLEACGYMDHCRLPELFCGFHRRKAEAPTLYPVACSPQAWASGAVFMMLEAQLGVEISPKDRRVRFTHPYLPEFLNDLRIENLPIGQGSFDLLLRRKETGGIVVELAKSEGDVTVELGAS